MPLQTMYQVSDSTSWVPAKKRYVLPDKPKLIGSTGKANFTLRSGQKRRM